MEHRPAMGYRRTGEFKYLTVQVSYFKRFFLYIVVTFVCIFFDLM